MRRERKENLTALLIGVLCVIVKAVCSGEEVQSSIKFTGAILPEESQSHEKAQSSETDTIEEEVSIIREIPVDFPFDELYPSKPYSLTLALREEPAGAYELRLYDGSGDVLQQIPCAALTEPLQFCYDSLSSVAYGPDLEIFSADSGTGLLYPWEGEQFSKKPIPIPHYSELEGSAMLVVEEDDMLQTKTLYQLNEGQKCVEQARSWRLQKDTGALAIRNELDNQVVFQGTALLNDEGALVNEAYYQMLFADELYWWHEEPKETTVSVWFDEPRSESTAESGKTEAFENVQKVVFGNNGHSAEYADREAFLSDCGFADSVPMYQYYDRNGNVQLELYRDEATDRFCGIVYEDCLNSEKKKWATMYGFTINTVLEQEWTGGNLLFGKNIYDRDMGDYEEAIEYTSSGQPKHVCYRGMTERERVPGELSIALDSVMEVNYVYRDDDTLFYREYWHDGMEFGTTLSTLRSFYDNSARVVYERGYITHGALEYYYIYEGEGKNPAYCLEIDHNLGYAISNIVRYQ